MDSKKLLLLPLLLILLCAAANVGLAQRRQPARRAQSQAAVKAQRPLTPEGQRRLDAFVKVWQVLNDYYFDSTFNGLNWAAIKSQYEPRARAARTDAELHDLLQEMIGRLGRSHLVIIPPEVYEAIESAKKKARSRIAATGEQAAGGEAESEGPELNFDDPLAQYGIGVDLRIIDGRFVIWRIVKNSAAEFAGLKTGFAIEKINEVSLQDLLFRVQLYKSSSKEIVRALPEEIVSYLLNGEKDSYVDIEYVDGSDMRQQKRIRRELLKAETVSIGKNFPEQQLEFETSSPSDDVGYLRFTTFAMPVIAKFCTALDQFKGKKALIIDLRGNTGGLLTSLAGLAGMLSDTPIELGTAIYKFGQENITVSSQAKNFKGKIVLLVDSTTASAAEMLAIALQESGRALVVGEKTAGASLPSRVVDLPTGAVLQYPFANFRSAKGAYLEGHGVIPNVPVALDRKSLLAGKDVHLDKALELIRDGGAFPAAPSASDPKTTTSERPPPPPRPAVKPGPDKKLPVLAELTVKAPPQPEQKEEPPVKDAASLKIIDQFLTAIGGRERLEKLTSYEFTGKAEVYMRGASHDALYSVYSQGPDKYAEIMSSDSGGELRQVYNGKNYFLQTDYGIGRDSAITFDISEIEILSPIKGFLKSDLFSSLKYVGVHERDGRKVNLIDARTKKGSAAALAFDVETRMLVYFTGEFFGMIFGDYRSVGEMKLPFRIDREGYMRIQFDEIKLNVRPDESRFQKKVNCYDIAN